MNANGLCAATGRVVREHGVVESPHELRPPTQPPPSDPLSGQNPISQNPMQVAVARTRDAEGFEISCTRCGEVDAMHPAEPWVDQMFIFLGQHRHPEQ